MELGPTALHQPKGRVCLVACQRLGDLLTAVPFIEHLRAQPEVDCVDVLHFSQTRMAADFLGRGVRCYALDYTELKAARRLHPLAGFARLRRQLDGWGCLASYDSCIVWGTTDFACHLAPLLTRRDVGRIHGVHFDHLGKLNAASPVTRYMNELGHKSEFNLFAHRDLYAMGCGFASAAALAPPKPRHGGAGPVALHLRSSSHDKDYWPLDHQGWIELAKRLWARGIEEFVLLGSPAQVDELRCCAAAMPGKLDLCTEDLKGTAERLSRCQALVSVDTVSIHLAAMIACPTVILRVGSSRGMAFVPGPHCLSIEVAARRNGQFADAEQESAGLDADDIAEVVAHYGGWKSGFAPEGRIAERLWLREGCCNHRGVLGLREVDWPAYRPSPLGFDELGWQSVVHDALYLGQCQALERDLARFRDDERISPQRDALQGILALCGNAREKTAA